MCSQNFISPYFSIHGFVMQTKANWRQVP